ncbi:ran-binding protein 9 isoform X2 [Sitophilus oryzae]|uniref:Ran-binding protein 9 isoform X2 n=1 Tax=Sitophilus oryzae TaxID=7048 RepID=A0A6J2Y7P4_SITOR|nr:ran-binding protein 9 isoform X2 [Sitophilus oryzae]
MAAVSNGRVAMDVQNGTQNGTAVVDRLKKLYPAVNEDRTPLPRAWSPKEKYGYIGLSQGNLRVHYKGYGNSHRDAASIQATHPIPAACGLYYFEVKIVSKGRDGYMGIGLSAQGVNLNRLPGWDKQSYGYHGDDGHSFCSSGTGQPYGPTFTTDDVIGCGVNLIDNTCFYTKNGHHLGTAFYDLPPNLYPTVGLQTPGEVVDANFGQEPFVFDIEDMMRELRSRTKLEIRDFPTPGLQTDWQAILNKMVSTYLIHHGYCNTAEAFAQITNQPFTEDILSIKNRQKIQKLVLSGRMGEAIDKTTKLYPGLLENNQNLMFMLKCRQFVEMVNGSDIEVCHRKCGVDNLSSSSPRSGSPVQTSVIQSTKGFCNNKTNNKPSVEEMNQTNASHNGNCTNNTSLIQNEDDQMEVDATEDCTNGQNCPNIMECPNIQDCQNGKDYQNGTTDSCTNGKDSINGYQNGSGHCNSTEEEQDGHCCDNEDDMDVDVPVCRKSCSKPAVERILQFGRELYSMSQKLSTDKNTKQHNQQMLEDAFSLLAYSNPWSSPVGWQLEPSQREAISASLNSAILESNNKPRKPPLEMATAHAHELIRLMSHHGLGACAFASLDDVLESAPQQ